jgi:hypothetical protein
MGYTNFTACAADNLPLNATSQALYGWHGTTRMIPTNVTSQISAEGCKKLCGEGSDYYTWSQSSNTITTWVLPVMGVLLQAPFLSNVSLSTCTAYA